MVAFPPPPKASAGLAVALAKADFPSLLVGGGGWGIRIKKVLRSDLRFRPSRLPDRYTEPVFRQFFREVLESGGALVAIDRATGQIIGSSRYNWFSPDRDELEIGWSFLARAYWGGVLTDRRVPPERSGVGSESVIFEITKEECSLLS